ncbi:hypothetical protein [Fictibacillus barbaricus]|uniref:Ribosomal protein L33 n=1 Tax=Fictibacillus barbaricus TaxID=182136 RepID=A0ABU1U5R1_9BACL|nr:hypothetical protein [Fictibacillus barbaricus]MDR7074746.1 ribosomal protein L33 [Fictibacillus barbaricus]
MVTITMECTQDKKRNGWVAEIQGFHSKYNFTNHFLKPKRYKRNVGNRFAIDKYDLHENKRYIIKLPDESTYNYAKVENDKVINIFESDVRDYLINSGHRPVMSINKVAEPVNIVSRNDNDFFLSKEIDYLFSNLKEAFINKQDGEQDVCNGIIVAVWNYATMFNAIEEFKLIHKALTEGKTSEEIKRSLAAMHTKIESKTASRAGILEKYNVPTFI